MFDETTRPLCELRSLIESALDDFLPVGELNAAVRYAVFSGGKRMRPLLTLLAAQACGKDVHRAIPAACAVELLHSASLIWDDLPCMDNASHRRGVPALHLVFGEARATLAALALLNQAYCILGRHCGLTAETVFCVGDMIEGQAIDLRGGHERPSRKTSGLIRLTLTAGAIACGAPYDDVRILARGGEKIGEAYQIYDDFEDGDLASVAGAEDLIAEAISMMRCQFGTRVSPLIAAIEAIVSRFAKEGMAA